MVTSAQQVIGRRKKLAEMFTVQRVVSCGWWQIRLPAAGSGVQRHRIAGKGCCKWRTAAEVYVNSGPERQRAIINLLVGWGASQKEKGSWKPGTDGQRFGHRCRPTNRPAESWRLREMLLPSSRIGNDQMKTSRCWWSIKVTALCGLAARPGNSTKMEVLTLGCADMQLLQRIWTLLPDSGDVSMMVLRTSYLCCG